MQKITPFLWFDNQAEEAMNYYTSIFKNSKVGGVSRYGEGGPMPAGTVMSATFTLDGQDFMALNAGPIFKFNEAVSFYINCENQKEVDYYWDKLTADGGSPSRCGWLKDKFGLSWQVIPSLLPQYLSDKNREKANRVMAAMMKMDKIDVQKLQDAYDGK